jgi:hypothetical protein
MRGKTETIRVRISPGVRMWQVLLVAAALVASLLLGLFIGRASAPPPDAGHALSLQQLALHRVNVI